MSDRDRRFEDLRIRQAYPLSAKIFIAKQRIQEFYEARGGKVRVSFSGGKDSQVLLHLVRSVYPNVPAVFSNTGLEYPEIVEHVRTFENVTMVRPKLSFKQVIEKFGYPVISKKVSHAVHFLQNPNCSDNMRRLLFDGITKKGVYAPTWKLAIKWRRLAEAPFPISDYCCSVLKKNPMDSYDRATGLAPYQGVLAEESLTRAIAWERVG